jgi:ribonuclease/clavin/mitogillin
MIGRPVTPSPAAALILAARSGRVLLGRRARSLAFLGGFLVSPGGRVEVEDHGLFAEGDGLDAARAAALRELVEEVGLFFDGERLHPVPPELAERPLRELAERFGADLGRMARGLEPAGRWVTPESSPIRFDTQFFLAMVEDEVPGRDTRELQEVGFVAPAALLDRWLRMEERLAPPTRAMLEALARGLDGAGVRLRGAVGADGRPEDVFEPIPGIRQLPLRTPTLPPAQHTNAYLLGDEQLLIVDPATYEESEREKLLRAVQPLIAGGARVQAIVLTHHHHDHVGAAGWLSERLGAPVWAHANTRALLEGTVHVDALLDEGQVLDLGRDRGGRPFALEVLFTPGHAPGHVVLDDLRPGSGAMIVGDMVAAVGTIIIDPSEGRMSDYLRQLERLHARGERVLFAAHGPPIAAGRAKLAEYLNHRRAREAKVAEALAARGRATPFELLPEAYADTPEPLWPLAARSCQAHLEKLVEDGRARAEGEQFIVVG